VNDQGLRCGELRDDLAAYALGALDHEEAARLERHLEACEACTARLRWLSPAIDLLPATVPQRTPPSSLRENLLTTVRAEAAPSALTEPEPARPARESWWTSLRGLVLRPATGMAVLILLVVGVGTGYLLAGPDEPSSEFVRAQPLNNADPVVATLERSDDTATLHVQELPAIAENEVYEVWVQRAGVMEARNVFVLDMNGRAEATIPGSLDGGEAVLVTREPRPGSRQPTTEPILTAPL
jgi:anti-sigma-K factor RskA